MQPTDTVRHCSWVSRHLGASTKLRVGGPTSLSIHPCQSWCQKPHPCLSLILTVTPKTGKKLENLPKVAQPENGRARAWSQASRAPESALNQWSTRWGPHASGAHNQWQKKKKQGTFHVRCEEYLRARTGRLRTIEQRNPIKGRGHIWLAKYKPVPFPLCPLSSKHHQAPESSNAGANMASTPLISMG